MISSENIQHFTTQAAFFRHRRFSLHQRAVQQQRSVEEVMTPEDYQATEVFKRSVCFLLEHPPLLLEIAELARTEVQEYLADAPYFDQLQSELDTGFSTPLDRVSLLPAVSFFSGERSIIAHFFYLAAEEYITALRVAGYELERVLVLINQMPELSGVVADAIGYITARYASTEPAGDAQRQLVIYLSQLERELSLLEQQEVASSKDDMILAVAG